MSQKQRGHSVPATLKSQQDIANGSDIALAGGPDDPNSQQNPDNKLAAAEDLGKSVSFHR